jgi:hypothetical protein
MANIRDLPLHMYTTLIWPDMSHHQITSMIGALSLTDKASCCFFKNELTDRLNAIIKQLCQAVIDDNCETVGRIAAVRPKLLLLLVTAKFKSFVIQSKYTYQRFDLENENILTVAVKRKQITMTKIILSSLAKLELTDEVRKEITAALKKWPMCEIKKSKGIIPEQIIIPQKNIREAKLLIKSLFEASKGETFTDGVLSEKLEALLSALLNQLLPEKAVKLDDYPDVELCLLAYLELILNRKIHDKFSPEQEKALQQLCVRVTVFLQSLLPRNTVRIVCANNWNNFIATEQDKIKEKEVLYKLKNGEVFCRPDRDSLRCLGLDFLLRNDKGSEEENTQIILLACLWKNCAPDAWLETAIIDKQKAIKKLQREWKCYSTVAAADSVSADPAQFRACRK